MIAGRQIRVRGTVQGVGFRPTVWRLARQCGLKGQVSNDAEGVLIRAWGSGAALDDFTRRVHSEAPPLARIDVLEYSALNGAAPADFFIAASGAGAAQTAVAADAAVCADCIEEIENSADRRHGYAFTNCTYCGPRLSIVRGIPYDRASTSMDVFEMCSQCRAEYEDPANRRFHAQPIACPACGPRLWLESSAGERLSSHSADALGAARRALRAGQIVAVKGLGGFHLACDARSAETVARLRGNKHRQEKPLALMARSIEIIRRYCAVSPAAAALLADAAAPIVLLPAGGRRRVAAGVAPRVPNLGFMLPYTPLHHLLLKGFAAPIVLTSGNLSDEPPCTNNEEARGRLAAIADVLLMHDRDIANRADDSVVRIVGGEARMLRRARGYAPAPLKLHASFEGGPQVLAMGGELKNTFCVLKGAEAILSPHVGDLERTLAYADYQKNIELFSRLFEADPAGIAVDAHPEYLSSKLGRERARHGTVHLEEVQHHHAHVAACLAENGWPLNGATVLGVVLDGLGYGLDGTLWGGEFLAADYRGFVRCGRLAPVAMLGGVQAIRMPWRSAYAHLCNSIGWQRLEREYAGLELLQALAAKPRIVLDAMLKAGINCPMASSCGRLFDAVAAAIGVCREGIGYEGQAAIELEALAERADGESAGSATAGSATVQDGMALGPLYPFAIAAAADDGLMELDAAPMWRALLDDLKSGAPPATVALKFHRGLAAAVVHMVRRISGGWRGAELTAVALSGGVFQNRLLFDAVYSQLSAAGFDVLTHKRVPSHDGGLSLGQAAVAAARARELQCA